MITSKEKENVIETLEKMKKDYTIYDGYYPQCTKEWYVLDEVIKELKKETVPRGVYEQECNVTKRLEAEILRLENIINNKWISVEEKLPEEHYAVLVYCPERKNTYCAYRDKNEWRIFGGFARKVELKVVAWRLLPTPPLYNLCDTNPFNDERFGG